MPAVTEDTHQQLYKSLFRVLTGDVALMTLLEGTASDPRVYQMAIDVQPGRGIEDLAWVTFGVMAEVPIDIEQLQQVWKIRYRINVYTRGIGSDKAEGIHKRTRELLNQHHEAMADSSFFVWYNLAMRSDKLYEGQAELWRVWSEYETMCVALDPS